MISVSKTILALSVCIFALGACSHYSEDLAALDVQMEQPTPIASSQNPQDIAPAAGTASAGAFKAHLARDYYDMARFENDKAYDYKAAKKFTQKAITAKQGQMTLPSSLAAYDIPDDKKAELESARTALMDALKTKNIPGNEAALARAQCRFDCWLERAEEAPDPNHYASCKQEFEQAMSSLQDPMMGSVQKITDIEFDENSTALTPEHVGVIESIAAFLASTEGAGYTAIITGFTDGQTPTPAVKSLATQRALNVNAALAAKGVQQAQLKPQIAPAPQTQTAEVMQVSGGFADSLALRRVQIFLMEPSAQPTAQNQ